MSELCGIETVPAHNELMSTIGMRARARRVPISGALELTSRCRLRCTHCYVAGGGSKQELTTAQWFTIIDEIVDMGCLFLLLTGGDPVLRPDFNEIYTKVKQSGMLAYVFTSAYHLPDDVLERLSALPPRHVDISLYGASNETYQRVAGVSEGFDRVCRNIERLLAKGVVVKLKTLLLKENIADVPAMLAYAERVGLPFRTDSILFPRFDGDQTPVRSRVAPGEAIRAEALCPGYDEAWSRWIDRKQAPYADDDLYVCGAGRTDFFVSSAGVLTPCLMARDPSYDLTLGSFSAGWQQLAQLHSRKAPSGFRCNRCELRPYCMYCPALMQALTGSETVTDDYVCQTAQERYTVQKSEQTKLYGMRKSVRV